MKALISALALLAFVAASTIPYVGQAQAQTQTQTKTKTHHVTHKKAKKKHVAKAKKTHKVSKKKKPASTKTG